MVDKEKEIITYFLLIYYLLISQCYFLYRRFFVFRELLIKNTNEKWNKYLPYFLQ